MDLNQVLKHLESPEEVLAVPLMEELIDWTTFFIHQLEGELMELDFQCDVILAQLAELHGSVAKAKVLLNVQDVYKDKKRKELTLKSLKSYRQNIRRKRDRIIPR